MIGKDEKLKRALLWLPARLYELGVRLRVAAYETDYLKPKRLNATVISVGNLSVGGTGKTPVVEYIARYLKEEGYSVAILTRGYKRRSAGRVVLNERGEAPSGSYIEFGDEPLMLARQLPGVPIIIDKGRYEGGRWAIDELGAEVLVLDDAFQHLALARDLNILLIDATDPFGSFEMVPFGRLREPLYGIKRADAVIVTRADRPFDQGQANAIVKHLCGEEVPLMYAYSAITHLRHLESNETYEAEMFAGWNVSVMCGIGNPEAFSDDLLQARINIVGEHFFADHHAFTQEDLDRVTASARKAGADAIVITEKDAVRLEGLKHGEAPVYAARLEIESDDEVRFKSLLLRTIIKKRSALRDSNA
ncbi:MAG: tetraacyldisaccharide 4'-kinase [Blastocatellia bacterium]|nr:tetraacyldisaccharide 4'-kinase [Blastocatellia bacterium]